MTDEKHEENLDSVLGERRHLIGVAYRLLGSLSEAEDAVQETYARWYRMSESDRRDIQSPGAWLTTVVTRVCLNVLRSARARRELYVGSWLPEPVPDGTGGLHPTGATPETADPADRVTLDESVTMAFLVVLDSMRPAERVALILHDVFGYPFAEVARIVGRSPAACRQLATSARRRLRKTEGSTASAIRHSGVIRSFRDAWLARDVEALVALLDPDAEATADGGGRALTFAGPIVGSAAIARTWVDLVEVMPADTTILERTVNGLPGLAIRIGATVVTVLSFDVHGDRIRRIWVARNPDKLRAWQREVSAPPPVTPAN